MNYPMPDSSINEAQQQHIRPRNQLTSLPKVFLQETCAKHQFIRRKDLSGIYERPERLRAAYLGISAAYARLESASSRTSSSVAQQPFEIIQSAASIPFNHLAVEYVHGADDGEYLGNLSRWARESKDKIAKGSLEIPDSLKDLEDDLYLCPNSVEAFQGGLGTVCEAVDSVVSASRSGSSGRRAFVVIRPPGHHCGEDSPNGFCFVNGIAVGAAQAYIEHDISRVVIFDIDLHHGNGTQEIVSEINQETYRDRYERRGLQMFYGSIHDISSYPCEEGKPELVADASRSVSGCEGQWLENIHLQPYTSEDQFWDDYESRYRLLFSKAAEFISSTGGAVRDDVLVLMSCGFDASEHESLAMNRHGCKVPTTFYHRFTRDVCKFAETFSSGRMVSVMEGGYDDRALVSGTMAHVCGLVDTADNDIEVDPQWWSLKNLQELEMQTKKRKGRKPHTMFLDPWLQRTLEISPLLGGLPAASHQVIIPPLKLRKPASSSVTEISLPRKRGRPRKHPISAPPLQTTSLAGTNLAVTSGTKRSRSGDVSSISKQLRSNGFPPAAQNTPTNTTFLSFSHPNASMSASITVDSALQLRWQPPNLQVPTRAPHPSLPLPGSKRNPDPTSFTFALPVLAPPHSAGMDAAMDVEPLSSSRRLPPSLVDLGRHWPKGQIGPSDIETASSVTYRCHTHYDRSIDAWGVRSIKNGLDQLYCYIPNHYKNGLRYLNYRTAQLLQGAEASFRVPRAFSTPQKKRNARNLRDFIQRALIYHHSVREAVFREVREQCYGGRDPTTVRPNLSKSVRLPTLDTWLLQEYAFWDLGEGNFDRKRLEAALKEYDPLDLDWEAWANTKQRRQVFGFDHPPSEKDAAMNKEAGIPVHPVVEGIPMKPDWFRKIVEGTIREEASDMPHSGQDLPRHYAASQALPSLSTVIRGYRML